MNAALLKNLAETAENELLKLKEQHLKVKRGKTLAKSCKMLDLSKKL